MVRACARFQACLGLCEHFLLTTLLTPSVWGFFLHTNQLSHTRWRSCTSVRIVPRVSTDPTWYRLSLPRLVPRPGALILLTDWLPIQVQTYLIRHSKCCLLSVGFPCSACSALVICENSSQTRGEYGVWSRGGLQNGHVLSGKATLPSTSVFTSLEAL